MNENGKNLLAGAGFVFFAFMCLKCTQNLLATEAGGGGLGAGTLACVFGIIAAVFIGMRIDP